MTKTFPNDIQNVDVVVLGQGPAGVAASKAASQEGAKVIIIDENASAGGQIYRAPPNEFQPHNSFKSPEFQEGEKQRTQFFKGVVLQRKGTGKTETFTIRKVSNGIGVERIFPINSPDIEKIEVLMRSIIEKKDPVRKETWDRERALKFYKEKNEPYKIELVKDIPVNEDVKMYWHGDWQDLCRGPHLVHTGQVPVDAFKLTRVAGAYWRGNNKNKMLQRIYGVAFRSKEELKQYFLRI